MEFLAAEGRWLALAYSYEAQHRFSRRIAEFDRRSKAGAITLTLREQGISFDLDDVARLNIAYHAVLHQLGLSDRKDGITLVVAKRIVDLAAQGERDPERLVAATLEALSTK
jgi:hypothetical protein